MFGDFYSHELSFTLIDTNNNKNIHNTTICKKIDFSENIVIETKKKKKQNHLKECFIDSDED